MHTQILVRHEGNTPRERSTCGWRDRLISREDQALGPAAWAHAVDIEGARPHYHKRSTELYYVLEGDGVVLLDGEEHPVRKGSLVHIPPGVVHGARGRMRVLVVGIPDIAEDDYFEASVAGGQPDAPRGGGPPGSHSWSRKLFATHSQAEHCLRRFDETAADVAGGSNSMTQTDLGVVNRRAQDSAPQVMVGGLPGRRRG